MQRSVLTTGIFNDFSSSASIGTINMAPVGQWRAQFPHDTPSETGKQFFLTHTACPILVDDFSSLVIGLIALVGQTSEQRVHSGRQYPRSYDISGCMKCDKSDDGRNTPFGHAETQSWHDVQCCSKCLMLHAPAGTIFVFLFGICLSAITANPPSTFFFCAFTTDDTAKADVVARKALRELPAVFSLFSAVFLFLRNPKLIAPTAVVNGVTIAVNARRLAAA